MPYSHKNGKSSSSKYTKHIKTNYLFMTEIVAQGDIEIEHWPTEKKWSEIMTKPIQGRSFR